MLTLFLLVAPLVMTEDVPLAKAKSQREAYDSAFKAADKAKCPLVVWVGQAPHEVPGAIVVRWDGYPDVASPCVVIGRGGKEEKIFKGATLPVKVRLYVRPNNVGHDLLMPVPDSSP